MRAVIITQPGGTDVLEVREVPVPLPGPHDVVVHVRAAGLNRADLLQRQGKYPAPPGVPPDIPGIELAGEIVECGAEARRWKIGARVFGIVGGGAHAERVTTHQDALAEIPASLNWTEAAAVPEAFITAHDALVTQASVQQGEMVLVHAVASGVGLAAVQLAHAWGATAYGTTRSTDKLDRARAYGMADGVVLSDDLAPLLLAVERWTKGRGVDVVLDLVGGRYFAASVNAAASSGRIMLIGTMGGATADVPLGTILRKRLVVRGTVLRSRSLGEKIDVTNRFAREVVPLLATGTLRPVIDCVLPVDRIAEAHERMASNQTVGKIVLTMDR